MALDPASRSLSALFRLRDGRVVPLVDEGAGVSRRDSFWAGETDINSRSIGIEIANPGHELGYRPFPKTADRGADCALPRNSSRHPIPPERVLAHSDVAPLRKADPGDFFRARLRPRRVSATGSMPAPIVAAEEVDAGDSGLAVADLKNDSGNTATALARKREFDAATEAVVAPSSVTFGPPGSTALPTFPPWPLSTSSSPPLPAKP